MPGTAAQTNLYFQRDNGAVQKALLRSQTSSQSPPAPCASLCRNPDSQKSLRQYRDGAVPPFHLLYCRFSSPVPPCLRCTPDVRTHIPTHSKAFPSNGFWKFPSPGYFLTSLRNALYRWTPESSLLCCCFGLSLPSPRSF